MFNKTILAIMPRQPAEQHNTYVNMVDPSIEKGARFLDEVQEKAAERITHAMLVDAPAIEAKLVTYDLSRSFESGSFEHHMAFTINGRQFDLRLSTSEDTDIAKALAEKLTQAILVQIAPSTLHYITRKAY